MFLRTQLSWNVIIPAELMSVNRLMLQKAIINKLMEDFSAKKATEELGYLLAVTTLDNVGEGRVRQQTADVLFHVTFSCLTFKMFSGEVLEGVADKILRHGVFLRCGPMTIIFLSVKRMPGYQHVPGESQMFINEEQEKIEKDVAVRFRVIGTKWLDCERESAVVVSLEGDFLGPV